MRVTPAELLALSTVMAVLGGAVGTFGTASFVAGVGMIRALVFGRGRPVHEKWHGTWNGRAVTLVRDGPRTSLSIDGTKVAGKVGELPALLVTDVKGARIAAEVSPDGPSGQHGAIYANGVWIGGDRSPDPQGGMSLAEVESVPVSSDPRWPLAASLIDDLKASSASHAPETAHHLARAIRLLLHRLDRLRASEATHAALGTSEANVGILRAELEGEISRLLDGLGEVHLRVLSADPPPSVDDAEEAVARIGALLEADAPLPRAAATPSPQTRTRGPLPDRA